MRLAQATYAEALWPIDEFGVVVGTMDRLALNWERRLKLGSCGHSVSHGCSPLNLRAEHSNWSKESTVVRTALGAPQAASVRIARAVANLVAIALAFFSIMFTLL